MSEARTIRKLEAMIYAQWCWHAHPNNGEMEWQESDTKKALDRILGRRSDPPEPTPSPDLPPPLPSPGRAL